VVRGVVPTFGRSRASRQEKSKDQSAPREKRVLVLGSNIDATGVRAHQWDRLPRELNVADYEVVILNFAPFEDESMAAGYNADVLPDKKSFAQLIFSHGAEVVALGDPNLMLGSEDEDDGGIRAPWFDPRTPVTWWLPVWLRVQVETGQAIDVDDKDWAFYFKLLDRYFWYWVESGSSVGADDYFRDIHRGADGLRAFIEPVASTRFQKPVGLKMRFWAVRAADHSRRTAEIPVGASGQVFWLPTPNRVSADEAVEHILRERYDLAQKRTQPAWVGTYRLPREAPIASRIAQLEEERTRIESDLHKARDDAAHEGRFRLMLFEKGEDILEPVVRDALRDLGADVTDPATRGKDDGRLSDPRRRLGTLEIKGRQGQIHLADVRQLGQWVSDARIEDGWDSKGIFIADAFCDTRIEDRGDAFPPNVVEAAERSDICLLTTPQLFEALTQEQAGELDRQAFWDSIFETSGVCPLPGLRP
jgi:hypothetical protein